MVENHERKYGTWEWDDLRKCWVSSTPHRIYPWSDGTYSAACNDVWIDGRFASFETAELAALGISESITLDRLADAAHEEDWDNLTTKPRPDLSQWVLIGAVVFVLAISVYHM